MVVGHRSEEMLEREAHKAEALVPISVDFDVPANHQDQVGIKIRDRFLWKVNGKYFIRTAMSKLKLLILARTIHHALPVLSDLLRRPGHTPPAIRKYHVRPDPRPTRRGSERGGN